MKSDAKSVPLGKRDVRKQERRAAIVAAARKSFLENGYAATSMSGLLTTLGGSKATLWSYFRSKEELFAAVIEDVTEAFSERLEEELLAPGDTRATIVMFCRSFMDRTSHPDAMATWRLVVAESGRSPEIGRIFYERAPHRLESLLSDYLGRRVAAGDLRDEDTLEMAQILIGMCIARQTRMMFGIDNGSNDHAAERFADHFMRMFLRESVSE